MRLLFTSDLQLGSGARYGTPMQSRLEDQKAGLDYITSLAVDLGVATVVVAGDIFQHRRPGIDELVAFDEWLETMPCEVLLLAGNHDVRGPQPVPTTIDLFGGRVDGVFTSPTVRILTSPDDTPSVAFGFLPWAHPGPLRAAREGSTPQDQAAALVEIAAGLRANIARTAPEAMPVLVTHFALSGMRTPSGVSTGELPGETVLDTHDLLAQGWSWVVAGHVHQTDRVETAGGAALSLGSPWVHDFGEAEAEHGVTILDSAQDTVGFEEVPGRRFVTLDLDAQALAEEERYTAISEHAGNVVRVRIAATEEEAAHIRIDELKRALYEAGAHKVFVHLDVERQGRARAEGMHEDTGPFEALEAWCAVTGTQPDVAERLRDLTAHLLEEA